MDTPYLLSSIDDVLREVEPSDGRPPDDGVMSGRRVRHLHRAELKERLAQGHAAQQQLPVVVKVTFKTSK